MARTQEIARLRALIADIPGWLTDEEGEALYDLASRCTGRGVIVEIGSWKGKSTTCLGLGSRAGGNVRIYAVDPHADYRFGEFKANIERAGIADLVTPIPSLSQAAAPDFHEPVELLFVDGSHEYDDVKADFDQWVPKLVEGGVLAVHDTTLWDGPKRVVEEHVYRSTQFKDVRFVFGSTTVATKVAQNTRGDRIRARYSLALKRSFELAYRARKLIPQPASRAARRILRAIR
ncbi:MAG: class I SAM-dependent methyltransferase [Gaiellaceae bacterium]